MALDHTETDRTVALLQGGDAKAFEKLFELFRPSVHAYCLRMLGNGEEAADATQEVFLDVLRDARSLRSPGKFRGWLFGIARHRVMMVLRARRNGRWEGLTDEIWDDVTPLMLAERREIAWHVRRAVASLSPAYREVVLLRDFQHLSYAEIAAATESSESAVKSRLHKARKALLEKLTPAFAEEDGDEMRTV